MLGLSPKKTLKGLLQGATKELVQVIKTVVNKTSAVVGSPVNPTL